MDHFCVILFGLRFRQNIMDGGKNSHLWVAFILFLSLTPLQYIEFLTSEDCHSEKMEIKKEEDQAISLQSAEGNTTATKAFLTRGRRPGCQLCGHKTQWIVASFLGGGGLASQW